MSEEKSLPSINDRSENGNNNSLKILPPSDLKDSSIKNLPNSANQPTLPTSMVNDISIKHETIEDRLFNSTNAGGLKELPVNFNDRNGDWKLINSENYFKILYLDPKAHKKITKNIIENNYRLLKKFCDEKYSLYRTGSGAIPIQLEQKYGVKFLNEAPAILKKAFDNLTQPDGIENYYKLLEKKRIENGRFRIQPLLDTVATIKILDPSTEELIKSKGLEAELVENEITIIIEEFLNEKRIVRGEYSSRFAEPERIFLYQIKKQLKDNLLSKDEENELKEDLVAYNISLERFEELLLQAFREVKDCEREYTLSENKKEFSTFYYNLLFDYGLDENGNLEHTAANKLFVRDSSPTDFFPLKKDTREQLIKAAKDDYEIKLKEQLIQCLTEALEKFQSHSNVVNEANILKESTSFKLLLARHREEIIKRATTIIEYVNELYFLEIGKVICKNQCWKFNSNDVKELITNPDLLSSKYPHQTDYCIEINEKLLFSEFIVDEKTDYKKLYNIFSGTEDKSIKGKKPASIKPYMLIKPDYEWLNSDIRLKLSGEITTWAKQEYEFEIKYFGSTTEDLLKKYKYGLPVDKQLAHEKNNEFHISEDERRSIIISMEKPLRLKAEKLYAELVESKVGNNTIIPPLITYLEKENSELYLLTEEKNNISFHVQTYKEIITSKSELFSVVAGLLIDKLIQERRFDSNLIKRFDLSNSACISREDILNELKKFNCEDEKQTSDLFYEFKKMAEGKDFYIVEATAESEFKVFDIFNKAVEISSDSYTLKISVWLTNSFIDDMIKIGGAYGMSAEKIREYIKKYRPQYLINTTPRWKELISFSSKVVIPFFLVRLFLSVFSPDWVFVENSNSAQRSFLFLDYLACVLPFIPSLSWLVFTTIVVIPFAFHKSVKGLLRSFSTVKIRLNIISVSIVTLISLISIIVGSSDKFKQSYVEKFVKNANSDIQNGKYDIAIKEYDKIFRLVTPQGKERYYYERGLIYEKMMVVNSSAYVENAISDFTLAINLNPNFAEYYILRGNCWVFKGDKSNNVNDYNRGKDDFIRAKRIDPSLLEVDKAILITDNKIIDFKKRIAREKRQSEYQRAGVFPNSKVFGVDVQLKTNHSFLSSSVQTLNTNEEVKKLDTWVINDPDIVEVISDVTITAAGVSTIVPAGALVKIIGKLGSDYIVSYKNKRSDIEGIIAKTITKEISGIEWVKIKTLSGSMGWILKNELVDL